MSLTIKVVKVTPAQARTWLKRNTINRPLRPGVVDGLVAAFKRGEYKLTHQGIAFSKGGDLLDGQHRLSAVAEMPDTFSIEMLVTAGLDADAFLVMDQGVKRSHGDVIGINTGHAACARYIATIHDTAKTGVTTQYLIPFVHGIEPAYSSLMAFCWRTSKTWSSAPVRSAAILQALNGGDEDYINIVYHALNFAEFDTMPPVAQTLFRQQLTGIATNRSYDLFCRAFKTFDKKNQGMTKLQISDHSGIILQARDIISRKILGVGSITKKKAPLVSEAKKVNGSNSTRRAAAMAQG